MNTSIQKFVTGTFFSLVIITGLLPSNVAQAAISEPGFETETVVGGLTIPTAMTFANDGRIFIAEKGGTVRVVKNGVLLPTPVIGLSDINTFGDRGLLGIAADPNFSETGYLYLSYTFENTPGTDVGGEKTGRIVRVTVVGDTALESSKVILVGTVGGNAATPSCEDYPVTADCIPSDSPSHSVGGLRFGPDGMLYATLGDGANFDYADPRSLRAQDLNSLAGKVLRIDRDGTAPTNGPAEDANPFYDGTNSNRSKVFALGVRNSFRFNFNPTTGTLFAGDVGWSNREEINKVVAGANYGWPCWEGTGLTSHGCTSSNTTPLYDYPHNQFGAGSVTAGAFPSNDAYPDTYDTSLFFGDYAQNWIKRIVLDQNGNFVSVHDFMDNPDGPVDITTGPDGNVYYLSIYTGELNRITHTTGNRRPIVEISGNPTSGLTPLQVSFTSFGSYDPDNDALTYEWNFDDGSFSNTANPSHTFATNGTYNVVMKLTDAHGASASKTITITAGNQAPTASITSPASGSLYTPNDVIQLTGTGVDSEDGTLPASAFHWQVILHHNTHTHIEQDFTNTKNPWFIAPDHSSADVYTEIILTVTDSAGLISTASTNLYLDNGSGVQGNLIQNPSVEIPADGPGGNPLNWLRGNFGLNNPTFTYPVTGFEGSKGLQLSMDYHVDGNAKWYFSPISVIPGAQYVYTEYYTATVVTSIYAQLGLSNGTYQYLDLGAVPAVGTPTKIERTVTIPAGVESLTVWHEIYAVGSLTTDNFSITHIDNSVDTTAPLLVIDSPVNGSTVSTTTTVAVTAGDSGGVAGVTLVVDGTDVGAEDTVAPYEFAWNTTTLTNGTHTISARARDIAGNTGTAPQITVTVSNQATPTNLIQNGDMETQVGTAPQGWTQGGWGNHTRSYEYPITGYNGGKALRTNITAYPTPPTGTGDAKWAFTKIAVTPGTQYTYSDHYRSNTISDIIGQYTLADGSFHYFGLVKEIQPSTTWNTVSHTFTPPANATHVTFFHLISAVGYIEIDDAQMYVSGSGTPSETNTPIVEITNPLAGQTIHGTVGITASSTDDTAVTYIFYAVDGIPVTGQIHDAPYLYNFDTTTVGNGSHTIKATTHDPSGNNSTHTITVNVDNSVTPPTNSNLIVNPSLESAAVSGDPTSWLRGGWGTNNRAFTYPVAGPTSAKSARVEITSYTNGDAKWYFAEVPVTGGKTYSFDHVYRSNTTTEVLARYTLTGGATQYQFLGNAPASATWSQNAYSITAPLNAVSLTVFHVVHSVGFLEVDDFVLADPTATADTEAPTVSIASPAEGATLVGTTTVSVTAADNVGVTGVTLLLDGTPIGVVDTAAPYDFTWDTKTVANGSHALSARAEDHAGNITPSATVNVEVNNQVSVSNLIPNASLETAGTGGNPQNWARSAWGTNTPVFTYPVAGVDGAKGARIELTSYTNGDAKWYFTDAPVTAGKTYTLRHKYKSSVSTNLTVRYTKTDGSVVYIGLGDPAASAEWVADAHVLVIPTGVVSMTLFHSMNKVGWLEVDDYALTAGLEGTFNSGMISFTFDDGWYSHYSQAYPILNSGNLKGVFYITSNEVLQGASDELIQNPSLETFGTGSNPLNWSRGNWGTNTTVFTYPAEGVNGVSAAQIEMSSYTNGDAKWFFADVPIVEGHVYTISDQYKTTAPSETLMRYTMSDGTTQYVFLAWLPSTDGTWQTLTRTVTPPVGAISMTMFHSLAAVGSLTVDNYSLKTEQTFMSQSQVLEMEANGHEIGGHTKTHAHLPLLTQEEKIDEIVNSRTDILAMGVDSVTTIAYPYGEYDQDVQNVTRNGGYIAARGVERGYNTKTTDKYALKIQQINTTTTLEDVQGWVEQAMADKTWLILMFHQIDTDLSTDPLTATPAFLQTTVNYIKTVPINVITVQEGVASMN
ncbi:MAG: PQQ-dependent sugar dehydrogenase [Candidatus Pacebacteria bacterium]|nr:PQQ-dependent sugar dehydrogenase [Candidatus Paceibacterota bacterium]